MKKYLLYTDYRANEGPACGYSYEAINAANIYEAIEIADRKFSERVYLMRIMEKVGKIETPYKAGYKYETYEATLCRRSYGWHRNTIENSESEHRATKNWLTNNKDCIWYEIA